jgi:hypothetical protein
MSDKNRWGQVIKDALELAHKKGLVVEKNIFVAGYSIALPNGSSYHAPTRADMVKFVRGY